MRGTWQTEDGSPGQVLAALGGGAIIGAAVWLIVTFLWVIAVIVGVALAAAIAGLVWLARHGGDVAMVAHTALPPPEAAPLPSRPSQALPAQQHVHYHLHLDGGQAAEAVRRQAITDRRTS